MATLRLMAFQGHPPGPGIILHQEHCRVAKDCSLYLGNLGARPDVTSLASLTLASNQHGEPWRAVEGFCKNNKVFNIDPTVAKPTLLDVQDTRLDSVIFGHRIVQQCTRQEKILQFLRFGSSELERDGLDLSLLSELMGLQALQFDADQHLHAPLICPSDQYNEPKNLVDLIGDVACGSKITLQPDGRVLLTGNGSEIKDSLSIIAEYYSSKNSTKSGKQSILVPHFSRNDTIEAMASTLGALKLKDVTTAPLKSPGKIKIKPSRKKNGKKRGSERGLYRGNYFHACESLLSLIMTKNQKARKSAILSLKRSGSELPKVLTQFSAGIAGTGLAILFSVICKSACGRVPFCAAQIFSIGFGVGLLWLSDAVNRLRGTIAHISKNASKIGLKDEDIMRTVDKNLKEIYFRAATVVAVAALRIA